MTSSEPHTIVQSWVSVSLAHELKRHARAAGCSLSALVRDALEENFAETGEGWRKAGVHLVRPAEASVNGRADDG
jgi:post-segregation antitoxin (ccd killing protein)